MAFVIGSLVQEVSCLKSWNVDFDALRSMNISLERYFYEVTMNMCEAFNKSCVCVCVCVEEIQSRYTSNAAVIKDNHQRCFWARANALTFSHCGVHFKRVEMSKFSYNVSLTTMIYFRWCTIANSAPKNSQKPQSIK